MYKIWGGIKSPEPTLDLYTHHLWDCFNIDRMLNGLGFQSISFFSLFFTVYM